MRQPALLAALACGALAGCGLDTIEIEVEGGTTIAGQPFGTVLPLSTLGPLAGLADIDFTSSKEFENGGYDADDIDSVRLVKLTMEVTEPQPPDGTFDFLESVTFFVEAEGEERKPIASKDPVEDGQRIVELDVQDVELKPYATAKAMTLTTEATGQAPRFDTTIRVKATFEVDVAVF